MHLLNPWSLLRSPELQVLARLPEQTLKGLAEKSFYYTCMMREAVVLSSGDSNSVFILDCNSSGAQLLLAGYTTCSLKNVIWEGRASQRKGMRRV